jgi:hypothetical protein
MLLSGEKLKANKTVLEEMSSPAPARQDLSSSKTLSLPSKAGSKSETPSPTTSSAPSPRGRSNTSTAAPKDVARPLNSSQSVPAIKVVGDSPTSSLSPVPKLPTFVPLKVNRLSDAREWSGEGTPEMSPRSRNPSRSPRASSPALPPSLPTGSVPASDPEPPPRPPKLGDAEARLKKEKQCLNIVNEIISSEEAYIVQLSTLLTVYRDPLLDAKCLDDGENAALFSAYANLLQHHKALLLEMQSKRGEIGTVMSLLLMPTLSLYKVHINRFQEMGELLRTKYEEDKNFRRVLSGLSHIPDTLMGLQALEIVRVASVQRLPRYILLLREVMKYTSDTTTSEAQARLHVIQVLEQMLNQLGNSV